MYLDLRLRTSFRRKLEELEVDKVILAPVLSDEDFERLFGGHPQFTGNLITQVIHRSNEGAC